MCESHHQVRSLFQVQNNMSNCRVLNSGIIKNQLSKVKYFVLLIKISRSQKFGHISEYLIVIYPKYLTGN